MVCQLEFKLQSPTPEEIEALHVKNFKCSAAGLSVPAAQIEAVCDALGNVTRYSEVREDGNGHVVFHALQQSSAGCPANILMEWWLMADAADNVMTFIDENFSGAVVLERHDTSMRYRLSADTPLSSVFRTLEAAKDELGMQEYGVCQTSLEQIFNAFAAQQDEETTAIRGVVQMPNAAAPGVGSLQAPGSE